jgi:hypothetical protein
MTFIRNALIAGVAATSLATAANAQYWWIPRGWHVIGTKTVNGRHDTDDIYTPGRQNYRAIRLCAYRAPIHLRDVSIRFNNGVRQDARVRDYLRANSCTRAIDLRGRTRDIARIRMKYDRIYRGRAPVVQVAALR